VKRHLLSPLVTKAVMFVGLLSFLIIPLYLQINNADASLDGRAYFDPDDSDGDGMSDDWEVHYFGDIAAKDGTEDDDLDDLSNLDEWLAGTNPLHLDPHAIGESGFVDIHANERGHWFTVRLDGVYTDPVVVVGPASSNSGAPMTIRVKEVTNTSFAIAIEDYYFRNALIDGYHRKERVSWMVVEAGTHTLPSGQVIQAGHAQVSREFSEITFAEEFQSIPTIFSQVTTQNDTLALVSRNKEVSTTSFQAMLQTQENFNHLEIASENLSWIAIETGLSESVAGLVQIGRTAENTNHQWRNVNFAAEQPVKPVFFCMMQTFNGSDTANVRYRNLGPWRAQVQIDEESYGDNEISHSNAESIGFLVGAPGMFHVLPTTGDTDGDGIADAYELLNGLVIGEKDYYGDLDGDGLTNAEESLAGTRADLVDTDGDGVSDYDEVNFLESDALAADVGDFELVVTIPGKNYVSTLGDWRATELSAIQSGIRGAVTYEFEVVEAGLYSIEFDAAISAGSHYQDALTYIISVDGEKVARETYLDLAGHEQTLTLLTPWLDEGTHEISILADNSYSFRRSQINEVRVLSPTGVDSNENGYPDWVDVRSANSNGFKKSYATSATSPVCLEGYARHFGLIEADFVVHPAPNDAWFANVALSAEAPTEVEVSYENGALIEQESITWVPTNLLAQDELKVRQGDAMLLTAFVEGNETAEFSIMVGDETLLSTADQPLEYRFEEAGEVTLDISYVGENSENLARSVMVQVVPLVDLASPVLSAGNERQWEFTNIPEGTMIQIDDQIGVFDGKKTSTGYAYTLGALTEESAPAVARLGYDGPILGGTLIRSSEMRSSYLTGPYFTGERVGTARVIEMPVMLTGNIEDVEVFCEIIKPGVVYEDGTRQRTLTAADFDETGEYILKFIVPKGTSSNCHRFQVFHNGVRIAYPD